MSRSTDDPKKLAFEFGFDWNTKPLIRYRAGVFALQVHTVDLDEGRLVSMANPSDIRVGDLLRFRVYDFSSRISGITGPEPATLQILFTAGTSSQTPAAEQFFSPIENSAGKQLSQLTFTEFSRIPTPSRAYGVASGWQATGAEYEISGSGRFELRALLTLANPGQPARFYEVDPEMVVGAGGTGSGAKPQ